MAMLELFRGIRVARAPAFFARPVVTENAFFVGESTQQIVKVDRLSLEIVSRHPSGGMEPFFSMGNTVVLWTTGGIRYRAITSAGRGLWEIEAAGAGMVPWRDSLVLVDDAVSLIDPTTGRQLAGPLAVPLAAPGMSALCGDRLVVANVGGGPLVAIHLDGPRVEWKSDVLALAAPGGGNRVGPIRGLHWDGVGTAVVIGDGVAVGCSCDEGRVRWVAAIPEAQVVCRAGRLYSLTSGLKRHATLSCLDTSTGNILYEAEVSDGSTYGPSRLAASDRDLAFGSRGGDVVLCDLATGAVKGKYHHSSETYEPAFADGRVLVLTEDGVLLVLVERSG